MVRRKVLLFFSLLMVFLSSVVLIQFMVYRNASITGNVVNSSDFIIGSVKPLFAFAAIFVFLVILVNLPRKVSKVSARSPLRVK